MAKSSKIELFPKMKELVQGLLPLLDSQLSVKEVNAELTYIEQRMIINSLFVKNSNLSYMAQVILRLTVIDSLYSTNAAYSYFSIEEMAENILSLGDEEEAADYFYNIATRKQTGKILFEERYGIHKNLTQGSKQMSLLSKYAYYLLLQHREKYPLGFPIYDSLALEQYPKLCKRLGLKPRTNIKDDIDDYIDALDEVRQLLFDNNQKYTLQQFDLLDAYLWRMGKLDSGNVSLLLSRKEYTQFIENIGLSLYEAKKEEKDNKDSQFAQKVIRECSKADVDTILKNIDDNLFKKLIEHWKSLPTSVPIVEPIVEATPLATSNQVASKFELLLKKTTTVGEFSAAFHNAFGAQVRVYNGRSRTEDNEVLGNLGLTNEGAFGCLANLTAGSFIERMQREYGLKVKVYTCDYFVAVLDGLTLEQAGKVKKNAVKKDMEAMLK